MFNLFKGMFGGNVDLRQLIAEGALLLDVRTREEYQSAHIKGSVNVPLNQLNGYVKKLKNKEQAIITCCASGMRSGSAKSVLQAEGFSNVHNGGSWLSVNRYA